MAHIIAVLSAIPRLSYHLRSRLPNIIVSDVWPGEEADTIAKLNNADVLVADCDLLLPYVNHLSSVKWIQATWAGLDSFTSHVQNTQRNYKLTRFTESFGQAMSEYVLAHIVNFERDQKKQYENQRRASWETQNKIASYRLLSDLTVGILGLGTIGKTIAERLKVFDVIVWGMTRTKPKETLPYLDEHRTLCGLRDILDNCDYIVNVLPSTPETVGLLNGNVLQRCQARNAVFINVGRGSVISESDLVNALEQKWISGAVLDVFEQEPLPEESKLWALPQVTITPHISGVTRAQDVTELFAKNYAKFVKGEDIPNTFDFERGY